MSSIKVAIITGGASGLGLATAEMLSAKRGWRVHVFDKNKEGGEAIANRNPNCIYHEVDVTNWQSLSSAFEEAFTAEGRLDFVFANAGISDRGVFFEKNDYKPGSLPPPLNETSLDVNFNGAIRTSYLALNYFRANPGGRAEDGVLVLTSSLAGLYPQNAPLYAAAKAGVLHFARSIARVFYEDNGIRTYCLIPSLVRTNFLSGKRWDMFPQRHFTSVDKIASVIEMFLKGGRMQDSTGKVFEEGSNYGLAAEVVVDDVFFRDHAEPANDVIRENLEFTSKLRKH